MWIIINYNYGHAKNSLKFYRSCIFVKLTAHNIFGINMGATGKAILIARDLIGRVLLALPVLVMKLNPLLHE